MFLKTLFVSFTEERPKNGRIVSILYLRERKDKMQEDS